MDPSSTMDVEDEREESSQTCKSCSEACSQSLIVGSGVITFPEDNQCNPTCLICSSPVEPSRSSSISSMSTGSSMNAIVQRGSHDNSLGWWKFLVFDVLELPNSEVERLYHDISDLDPNTWLKVCDSCHTKVSRVRGMFSSVEWAVRGLRAEFKELLKKSLDVDMYGKQGGQRVLAEKKRLLELLYDGQQGHDGGQCHLGNGGSSTLMNNWQSMGQPRSAPAFNLTGHMDGSVSWNVVPGALPTNRSMVANMSPAVFSGNGGMVANMSTTSFAPVGGMNGHMSHADFSGNRGMFANMSPTSFAPAGGMNGHMSPLDFSGNRGMVANMSPTGFAPAGGMNGHMSFADFSGNGGIVANMSPSAFAAAGGMNGHMSPSPGSFAVTGGIIGNILPSVLSANGGMMTNIPPPTFQVGGSTNGNVSVTTTPKVGIFKGKGEFPCDFCDKIYAYKKSLRDHVRKHHADANLNGGNPQQSSTTSVVKCNYCPAMFVNHGDYKQHLEQFHSNPLPI